MSALTAIAPDLIAAIDPNACTPIAAADAAFNTGYGVVRWAAPYFVLGVIAIGLFGALVFRGANLGRAGGVVFGALMIGIIVLNLSGVMDTFGLGGDCGNGSSGSQEIVE